jgi:tetratricopeptide (TPR) repeat protein
MTPSIVAVLKLNSRAWLYELQGAFSDAIAPNLAQANQPNFHIDAVIWAQLASDLARDHDPRAAKTMLDQHHIDIANAARNVLVEDFAVPPHAAVHLEDDKPRAAVDDLRLGDEVALKLGNESDIRHALFWPWLSYALARSGDAKAARALIARTPHDCTLCLEMRGRVAELGGDMKGAALWYARAVADAPSIPFTYTDWGAMLLHKGDYDGAIAKFTVANQKGPHFADPLEMWGEALMLKNRSDLALAKFEDANKYAPNWGRLHMKWGEALGYVGRKDEARAQYRIASTLDLSVADQAELTRDMRG